MRGRSASPWAQKLEASDGRGPHVTASSAPRNRETEDAMQSRRRDEEQTPQLSSQAPQLGQNETIGGGLNGPLRLPRGS